MPDNLLVNRNGQTYQVDLENTAMIEDTDLLLVNRDGVTYTVPGSNISRGDFSEVTISPLGITPETSEQIITATADIPKVGNSVPADVVWTWYLYDEATGDVGKTQVQSTTNREITDTFILPASAASKFIGCSVEYLAVTIDETQRCAVGLPDGPVADMNGLRFDSTRSTYLTRSSGSVTSFTFSAWCKFTSDTTNFRIFDASSNSSGAKYFLLQYRSSSKKVEINSNEPTISFFSTNTFELNEWNHFVFTWDGSEGKIYANGEFENSGTVNSPTALGADFISSVGRYLNSLSYGDGYLSDVYFVDGLVLEPTAFGEEFPEGWGPLDGSQVINNISAGKVQPYDTRPILEEKWSDGVTNYIATGSTPSSQDGMFDGNRDTLTTTVGSSAETLTWTSPADIPITNSLQIVAHNEGGVNTFTLIDGAGETDITSLIPASNNADVSAGTLAVVDLPFTSPLKGLKGTTSSTYQLGFAQVYVDGRLLIDGPADNSQVWSSGPQEGTLHSSSDWSTAFNGIGGSANQVIAADSAAAKLTFPAPATGSQAKVKGIVQSGAAIRLYFGNGTNTLVTGLPVTGDGTSDFVDISSNGGLAGIESISNGANRGAIYQVLVDDKVLIDAPAKWNTSQIWSNDFTCDKNQNPGSFLTSAFDGDLTTYTAEAVGSAIYNFVAPLTGNYRISMFTNGIRPIKVDGVTVVTAGTEVAPKWYDIGSVTAGQTITVDGSGQAGGGFIAAFEVDGIRLVDQGNFGSNGFYLPFNPDAGGVVYSDGFVTTSGAVNADQEWENLFDGNLSSHTLASPDAQNATATLALPSITWTDKVEVYYLSSPNGAQQIRINDTNIGATRSHDAWDDITDLLTTAGITQLDSITIGDPKGNTNTQINYAAIRVDDEILIDRSAIGTDASGQGNHFRGENFVTTTDYTTSSNWIDSLTSDSGWSGTRLSAFDGDPSTYASTGNISNTGTINRITFTGPVTVQSSIEVTFTGMPDTSAVGYFIINGNQSPSVNAASSATAVSKLDYTGSIDATTPLALWFSNGGYSGGWSARFINIKVDGKELIQGAAPAKDTVLDTPLFDYAVLDGSGMENGNLDIAVGTENNHTSTIPIPAGSKIYWEVAILRQRAGEIAGIHGIGQQGTRADGAGAAGWYLTTSANGGGSSINGSKTSESLTVADGDLIGFTFDSNTRSLQMLQNGTPWKTLTAAGIDLSDIRVAEYMNLDGSSATNFGQQSFLYATDNGNGTVNLIDTSPNRSQKWSDSTSANPVDPAGQDFTRIFDGSTSSGIVYSVFGTTQITFSPAITGSKIEIYADNLAADNSIAIPGGATITTSGWNDTGVSSLTQIPLTRASGKPQQVIRAIRVDGRILIDGPADTSQVWSDNLTSTEAFGANNGPEKAFNGIVNQTGDDQCNGGGGSTLTWNGYPQGTHNVRVWGFRRTTQEIAYYTLDADGNPQNEIISRNVIGSDNTYGWIDFGSVTDFTGIQVVSRDSVTGAILGAVEVDGTILIDGQNLGPYSKLYQTWSQWVIQTLRQGLAEADALRSMLLLHAQTYSAGEDYCEGSVIKAFGELWIAVNDAPATTFADLPAIMTHPNWEQLNISIN